MNVDHVKAIVNASPHLEELYINSSCMDTRTWDAMRLRLPKLKQFRISSGHMRDASYPVGCGADKIGGGDKPYTYNITDISRLSCAAGGSGVGDSSSVVADSSHAVPAAAASAAPPAEGAKPLITVESSSFGNPRAHADPAVPGVPVGRGVAVAAPPVPGFVRGVPVGRGAHAAAVAGGSGVDNPYGLVAGSLCVEGRNRMRADVQPFNPASAIAAPPVPGFVRGVPVGRGAAAAAISGGRGAVAAGRGATDAANLAEYAAAAMASRGRRGGR